MLRDETVDDPERTVRPEDNGAKYVAARNFENCNDDLYQSAEEKRDGNDDRSSAGA